MNTSDLRQTGSALYAVEKPILFFFKVLCDVIRASTSICRASKLTLILIQDAVSLKDLKESLKRQLLKRICQVSVGPQCSYAVRFPSPSQLPCAI